MARTHFETLIEAEKSSVVEAILRIPANDTMKFAELRGMRSGLDKALELYRKAASADLDSEAA